MYRVQQTGLPAAPKQVFCSVTGMTCTVRTESMWANGFIYATIRHCDGADVEAKYRRQEHALMLTLSGGSDLTRVKAAGSPIYEGQDRPGCVTFAPANADRQGWHRNPDLELLILLISPGFVRSCEFGRDALDIPSFTNAHDPLLESVLWSLAREMRSGIAELPSVYTEHAAGLLMAHLIHSMKRGRAHRPSRTGLSVTGLRQVVEFIEENLSQDISLTALAALTRMRVDVFARNFKACMGAPPYRYVLERRIHRAQALLTATGKPIAEIAFEVGFSSQAHFSTQFSKFMNMSPAFYRSVHRK